MDADGRESATKPGGAAVLPESGVSVDLSLIICTRNRSDQLAATLDSLRRLRVDASWEVIVVDNGSTDATGAVVHAFGAACPQPVVLVAEPTAGLGRARNAGLRRARGAIVVFTDDDCYPAEDYLARALECFAECPPPFGYLGGRVLLHDPTDLRVTIQERTDRVELPARAFISAGLVQGANMAFRRSAIDAVGGFDDRMGAGTPFPSEDVEMLARLSAAGWTGAYDPRPLVYHHHRRKTAAQAEALARAYDYGRGAYYAKCLLNPVLRRTYARKWLRLAGRTPRASALRELSGAVRFWGRMLVS